MNPFTYCDLQTIKAAQRIQSVLFISNKEECGIQFHIRSLFVTNCDDVTQEVIESELRQCPEITRAERVTSTVDDLH
eukprot:scaffold6781_cov204-Amphora_coffeaeformis.AAC.13